MTPPTSEIDFGWFKRHLLDEILPKWLAARTDQGLFLPHFDRQWRPLHRNFGTLVSQCRLLYNFAQGYALTGDATYRDAVAQGAHFLLTHFRDTQHGGWYWSCGLDGAPIERRKDGYGHAFTLFGLAHAYHCTGDAALREAMFYTWDALDHRVRDAHGGYCWRMHEDFTPAEPTRSQNPVMHLFEALLTAATVGGAPELLPAARRVGDFVLQRLVRAGDRRLPEVYDSGWTELPVDTSGPDHVPTGKAGRLDIGHAFEWAYLTSLAAEMGFPADYSSHANSFMLYGLAVGYDWTEGGIRSPATPSGQLVTTRKGWWEQCETVRALLNFAVLRQRADLLEPLQQSIAFVQNTMIDPDYGGWYYAVGPGIDSTQFAKGNEWKLDYHVVGMCMEAIRLADRVAMSPTA